ncbi:hypothetical protein [Fictibacillus fluitans]|uniref:Uncharacterized protein n=1 Tax=Fictibacillus fluitans TaxID=3058422 RepID=A0ABT8HTB3_9BACL|nr:hypothetical protein [Fictibacillus sp. NE201]MDN4523969.1 hypothetical protein [Fictibacillus sp. NE201]
MADNLEPMIKLQPDGKAPILSYNVPEPTKYSGRNYIELEIPSEYFKEHTKKKPEKTVKNKVQELDPTVLKDRIGRLIKGVGFEPELLKNNDLINSDSNPIMEFVNKLNKDALSDANEQKEQVMTSTVVNNITEMIASRLEYGQRLIPYTTFFGDIGYIFRNEPETARPRLLLVETYQLSTYLGDYGAGRTIKTFSLLPGEKTKITIKTFRKTEIDEKSASSIFDSFTKESANEFEKDLGKEQSDKENYQETFEYHAEAEADCSWGFGSAKISGGVKGGTNSAREEFAKNTSRSAEKHASKASAKRDIQINTSNEAKVQEGEETSIEREIQNINVSRTLNFVFRQMNQEFISLLHLVDVRVAYYNGFSYKEVALPDLDLLLEEVIIDKSDTLENRKDPCEEIKQAIIAELTNIYDYQDKHHSFVQNKTIELKDENGGTTDTFNYYRVRKDIFSKYTSHPEGNGLKITVPGIILAAKNLVIRTDGVIIEAMLGQGDGLDEYSHGLQDETVKAKNLANSLVQAQIKREELGQKIIEIKDEEAAKVFERVFSPLKEKEGGHA